LLSLPRHWSRHADRHLVHACQPPFESRLSLAGASDDELHHYRMAARQEAVCRVAAFLAGLPAEESASLARHVLHGHPSAVVQERLRRLGSDLLVLGRHGGSVLSEHLLGSVTRNLLHRVTCDVLLVP
ncbi:universal stress protein, partial [bacterium]|nr:universal stress protein [bacterium]